MPSWLCKKKKLALSGLLKEIENYGVNVAHHGQFNGTCDFFPQFYLRGKLSVVIKHNGVKYFLRMIYVYFHKKKGFKKTYMALCSKNIQAETN